MMKIGKGKKLLLLGILLVVIDQVIKVLVKVNLPIGGGFHVIGNWFRILFIENEGMAFGMKFGGAVGKFLLSFFRVCLFGFLCWWITQLARRGTPKGDEAAKPVPTGVLVGLTLITAGALGNILDSLFYGQLFTASGPDTLATFGGSYAPLMFGKVVDMFYFPLIDTTWPSRPCASSSRCLISPTAASPWALFTSSSSTGGFLPKKNKSLNLHHLKRRVGRVV